MILRDWQRLAWNVLIGAPVAYVVGLVALCIMLAVPPLLGGADASIVTAVLILGVPAFPLSYVFGVVPFLLISIATSLLARFVRGENPRILIAGALGGLALWWLAFWSVGPGRQFDAAEFNTQLIAAAPIGGAISAAACAWLTERFGSRRGLPEDYL